MYFKTRAKYSSSYLVLLGKYNHLLENNFLLIMNCGGPIKKKSFFFNKSFPEITYLSFISCVVYPFLPSSNTRRIGVTNTSISSARTAIISVAQRARRTIFVGHIANSTRQRYWRRNIINALLSPRPAASPSVVRIGTQMSCCLSCASTRRSNTYSSGETHGIYRIISIHPHRSIPRQKISNPLSNKSQISNVKFPI